MNPEPHTPMQERARILGKTATPRAPGEEGAEGKDDKSGPSGYGLHPYTHTHTHTHTHTRVSYARGTPVYIQGYIQGNLAHKKHPTP